MPRRLGLPLVLALSLPTGAACTPTTELGGPQRVQARSRVAVTQGSAVAITQDERIAVLTNRTDGVVSVVHLDPKAGPAELVLSDRRTELPFHPLNASKPWAAVIAPDDDTAYVLLRGSGEVIQIQDLHGQPRKGERVAVGSEPTSIVISPTGTFLYVANSGEGTVSSIVTDGLNEVKWDLNHRLAESGLLGTLVAPEEDEPLAGGFWKLSELQRSRRPALAHPRALALTDDGDEDDLDETLYATEFFAQSKLDAKPDIPDASRQGVVYPIVVGVGAGNPPLDDDGEPVSIITLEPVADTGFRDSDPEHVGGTGCFPNQLYGAATSGSRLYVTSMCASPGGPIEVGPAAPAEATGNNFKTMVHPAVFVIDTEARREVFEERVVLTQALHSVGATSDPNHRMPLIPNEIVVAPSTSGVTQGYISAFGASAVFPIRFEVGGPAQIGAAGSHFIALGSAATPSGLAILSKGRALVLDDSVPALRELDLEAARSLRTWDALVQDWQGAPELDPSEVVDHAVRAGRRLFATGLGVWSLQGQAWSSCESCHPEGLGDGVTWRFPRGPRRTISLAGTYVGEERRVLLWTANADEVHDVEGIARRTSGGVGGVLWSPYAAATDPDSHPNCRLNYDGSAPEASAGSDACYEPMRTSARHNALNGALAGLPVASMGNQCLPDGQTKSDRGAPQDCDMNATSVWDEIDAFVRSVRAPRPPSTLDSNLVETGKLLFIEQGCAACHGGPSWTTSRMFYEPGAIPNGDVPAVDPRTRMPPEVPDAAAEAAMLGTLRTTQYQVPSGAPAAFGAAGQLLPFRTDLGQREDLSALDLVFGTGMPAPPPDQILCVLRSVGTFPSIAGGDVGVVPALAPPLREVRRVIEKQPDPSDPTKSVDVYVDKLALGANGFNVPSLVGLSAGGGYFHAGNARTLEELFDTAFFAHHGAIVPFQPDAEQVRALTTYLLSIDESSEPVPLPAPGTGTLAYDPDLCAQFR